MRANFRDLRTAAVGIALLIGVRAAAAQAPPSLSAGLDATRESLRGLKGIRVAVRPIDPAAEQAGLDQTQLQTDVELKLRKAGAPVIAGNAAFDLALDSYVDAQLILVKGRFRTWAYSVSVQLKRAVKLTDGTSLFAATWQKGEVGLTTTGKLKNLRETVGDLCDALVNDYLAANPRWGGAK